MDSLIDKLCDDLEPVKCTRHPFACSSAWVLVSILVTIIFVWKMGTRHDLATILIEPDFIFELVLVTLTGLSAIYCTALLRVPNMRGQKWALIVPLIIGGLFLIWKSIHLILGHITMPHLDFHHCMSEGLIVAAMPAILMFIMALQGCTTHPIWMLVMNGLAVASVSYIALRLTCSSEDLGHILYTHLLPFTIVGAGLGLLVHRIYRW